MSFVKYCLLSLAGLSVVTLSWSTNGRANEFARNHPRRAQVLRRDRREIEKNNAAAASGKITKKQAKQLNHEDRAIRRQEQVEAAANGGHITKAEQRQLNREEGQVNRQRLQFERKDAAAGGK